MATTAEILARVREFPLEDRLVLSVQIAEEAVDERARRLSDSDRSHIEGILADRVEGPFEDLPSKEAFTSRVMDRAARINARRNG